MLSQWQRKAGEKVNLHGEINEFHKTKADIDWQVFAGCNRLQNISLGLNYIKSLPLSEDNSKHDLFYANH